MGLSQVCPCATRAPQPPQNPQKGKNSSLIVEVDCCHKKLSRSLSLLRCVCVRYVLKRATLDAGDRMDKMSEILDSLLSHGAKLRGTKHPDQPMQSLVASSLLIVSLPISPHQEISEMYGLQRLTVPRAVLRVC